MSKPGILSRIGRAITRARVFASNLLFVVIVVILIALIIGSPGGVKVPAQGALVLNPKGALVDQQYVRDPLAEFLSPVPVRGEAELQSLVKAIERAADDHRITTLVLDLNELASAPLPHAETLGAAITAFRASNKQVIAYGNAYSQAQYLIASYSDAVYMHPLGQIVPTGLSVNHLYLKELLNKLKVNIHIFRVGKYKEFVEPYTRTDMSEEAREANRGIIDALWGHYVQRVLDNRQLPRQDLDRYVGEFAALLGTTDGDMARLALEFHLVDELLTPDQLRVRIGDRVGYSDDGEINGIGYLDYLAATGVDGDSSGDGRIGVITARGPILMSGVSREAIAADKVVDLIRRVREDEEIAALVFRIDSPGGSAFASELIRQELELTQIAGKPVVVSMSSVTASGGYWIASTADRIVAQPTTITGSIGIFAIFPTFEDSLASIGVATDGVGTAPLSRAADPLTGLSDAMASVLQASVNNGYGRFLNLVARGRDMAPEDVDKIAQGRVWTGAKALELGLVDDLGGLQEALDIAAGLVELTDYGVKHFRDELSPEDLILKRLAGHSVASSTITESWLFKPVRDAWALLSALDDPTHSYALCVACTIW